MQTSSATERNSKRDARRNKDTFHQEKHAKLDERACRQNSFPLLVGVSSRYRDVACFPHVPVHIPSHLDFTVVSTR
jgi:hypothetical protein